MLVVDIPVNSKRDPDVRSIAHFNSRLTLLSIMHSLNSYFCSTVIFSHKPTVSVSFSVSNILRLTNTLQKYNKHHNIHKFVLHSG